MADEVIIEEYASVGLEDGSTDIRNKPTPNDLITTQVLDIATASAALNSRTVFVRIQSKGTGFWYKVGDSSVSAAPDTDGNCWLPADQFRDYAISSETHIDTAADA